MAAPAPKVHWVRLLATAAAGGAVWLLPAPPELSLAAWRVFSVFCGVVAGFLLRPLDMAPTVLLGILALLLTRTVDLETVIATGFGDHVVWLVVLAFIIADAVQETGLGRRIALVLLRTLGRGVTGLAYAIAATELALAPFIPSNTARGGGIVAPIVFSLAETMGSRPEDSPRLGGAYLVQVGAHSNLVTSAMFLTAMAGNGLLPKPAKELLGVDLDYATWLQGSIVPGLFALLLVPLVVRLLERPDAVDVDGVRRRVKEELAALGPPGRKETTLAVVLAVLLGLWSLQHVYGATTVALAGVVLLVLLGVHSWREVAGCARAWDALIWLGGFVALANALKTTGFTVWFARAMESQSGGWDPVATAIVLALIYFASMYLFSQLTAHIAALAGVFLAVAATSGAPPLLTVALIAYFSCLCGSTTPWSTGPVIIYFGGGYVSVGRWMRNGLVMAVFQTTIWLGAGLAWWRFLGWW